MGEFFRVISINLRIFSVLKKYPNFLNLFYFHSFGGVQVSPGKKMLNFFNFQSQGDF